MDPLDALSKPNILEHLPIFLALIGIIGITLTIIAKRGIAAYNAAKTFVAEAVDQRLPEAIAATLEERAPAIFDKVVAERLAVHEEVEQAKMENALHTLKNSFDSDRLVRDQKITDGIGSIMDKLSGVDSRLQVVQIRIESHDARLRAVEEVVQPLRSPRPTKKKKR